MSKQAIGWAATNCRTRFDSTQATLDYPQVSSFVHVGVLPSGPCRRLKVLCVQRPLVSTALSREMGFDELPSGCNPIVAIMSYNGYNQCGFYCSVVLLFFP